MTNSIDNLIFLEFVDEAKILLRKYLKDIQAQPEKFKVVSFHPLVKEYLGRHNISSVDSFHFCPATSHQELLVKLQQYTEEVRKQCKLEDSVGIRQSYIENLLYSLRAILSTWLYRVEVISNAIENYKPKVIISVGPKQPYVVQSLWVESVERYITNIIDQICSKQKITLKNLPMEVAHTRLRAISFSWLENICKSLVRSVLRIIITPKRNLIVAPSTGYGMAGVLRDLRRDLSENYQLAVLDFPPITGMRYLLKSLFKKNKEPYTYLPYNMDRRVVFSESFIRQKESFRHNLCNLIKGWSYRNVKCGCWLRLKFTRALEYMVIDMTYYRAVNFNKFMDRYRPMFVLSQHSRGLTAVMGELCKLKHIPSLIIPHGSFAPITDEFSKKEWRENALGMVDTPYEYLALQTPLIEKFLQDVPVSSKPVVTGPLVFGRKVRSDDGSRVLRKKYGSGDEKIILHAGTPKHRKGQRFFNYETIDEYIDGTSSLIKAVDNIKGVHLILRYRVIDGLNSGEIMRTLPKSNSYSIASDGSFIDYLSIADLLVSYSSSAMEEALQNNVPVLIYNKYNRYQHIRGKELFPGIEDKMPSAVYNVNCEKNLLFAIEWILKNHLPCRDSLENMFDIYKYKSNCIVPLAKFIKEIEENSKK